MSKIDLPKTVKHVLYYKEIHATARLILLHLVQVMNWETCEAKTTHTRIAADLKIGEKTVRRQLKTLESMSLIQVTNTKSRGLNDANIYKLLPVSVVPKLLESQSGQNDHTSGQNDYEVPVKMTATIGQNDREVPVKMTEHIHTNNHTINNTNSML